ncbi:MAG TPA: hypothetical protein VI229_00265 [Burkholderiales bacterium]
MLAGFYFGQSYFAQGPRSVQAALEEAAKKPDWFIAFNPPAAWRRLVLEGMPEWTVRSEATLRALADSQFSFSPDAAAVAVVPVWEQTVAYEAPPPLPAPRLLWTRYSAVDLAAQARSVGRFDFLASRGSAGAAWRVTGLSAGVFLPLGLLPPVGAPQTRQSEALAVASAGGDVSFEPLVRPEVARQQRLLRALVDADLL